MLQCYRAKRAAVLGLSSVGGKRKLNSDCIEKVNRAKTDVKCGVGETGKNS